MRAEVIAVCVGAALLAGFVHGTLGMGFGMIAMATISAVIPYNNAAAIVSVALLVLVFQVSIALRRYIDLKAIAWPCLALFIGKILGIVLMMHIYPDILRLALGLFLTLYAGSQLLDIKAMKICGTMLQGIVTCALGGLLGGIFNVSGPFASIYCQAKFGDDPKAYTANMNAIFAPSAVAAVFMHIGYGNFDLAGIVGSGIMVLAVLLSAALGVSVLKKLKAKKMFMLSNIYIMIMGLVICAGA